MTLTPAERQWLENLKRQQMRDADVETQYMAPLRLEYVDETWRVLKLDNKRRRNERRT